MYICLRDHLQIAGSSTKQNKMKTFLAQVEEGKEGKDGNPSVGPVYRNVLSKDGFPPLDSDMITAWDIFR